MPFKINGTLVKKKNILQISLWELQNDTILPIYEGVFLVQEKLMENYVLEISHLGSAFQNILSQWATEIRLHVNEKPV